MPPEPNPTPPPAPSGSHQPDPRIERLRQMVDQVDGQIHDLYRTQRVMRLQFAGASLLILLMLSLFGYNLYATMRQRLDQQKLQAALLEKAEHIWPQLSQRLLNSLANAAPVYRDLAKERWSAIRPTLEARVRDQAGQLAQRLQARLTEQANTSMDRVAKRVEADLKREFPNLTDEKLARMGERLKEDMAGEGGRLAEHVKGLVEKEKTKVEEMLERLPVQEELKQPKDQLTREFIHHILMLVDYEVSVAGTKEGLDQIEHPVK